MATTAEDFEKFKKLETVFGKYDWDVFSITMSEELHMAEIFEIQNFHDTPYAYAKNFLTPPVHPSIIRCFNICFFCQLTMHKTWLYIAFHISENTKKLCYPFYRSILLHYIDLSIVRLLYIPP